MYGGLRNLKGDRDFIPFRQLGQYEDVETDLYYNRYRYYSPDTGLYLSQDRIGLAGNNPNFYAYVHDSNSWVDVFGLDITTFYHAGSLSGPIDPSKGRPNLDFNPSGQGGFYVTTDEAQAAKWAEMRGHPE
ncbi:RHS repeat-associated core domain-containing protein [Flavobacterium piscis]|uniref:RHS repeat-associated core domain-containing protein n=1 Tax=Flavobacterium piscis TaxID=1114874 RepID=UPI00286C0FBE|nr:RHS repeat-associated core domain-containing protein [Flavobacterium piscis]